MEAILAKKDVIVFRPTGGGKSITFIMPVLIEALRVTKELQQQAATASSSSSVAISAAPLSPQPAPLSQVSAVGTSTAPLSPQPASLSSPLAVGTKQTLSYGALVPACGGEVNVAEMRFKVLKIEDVSDKEKLEALELLSKCFPLRGNREVLHALIFRKVAIFGSTSLLPMPLTLCL